MSKSLSNYAPSWGSAAVRHMHTKGRGVCSRLVRKFIGVSVLDDGPVSLIPYPISQTSFTCIKNVKFILLYVVCVLFGFLAIVDIVHLASGGEYEETPYGHDNPMIAMLGFCSSQITLGMSFIASIFIIIQAANIAQCAQMLDHLLVTFNHCCDKVAVISQKTYLMRFLVLFLVFGLVRLGCAMGEPEIVSGFYNETKYVWLAVPSGAAVLYNEFSMLAAMFFYLPVTALFTYFCSILLCCLQAFRAENEALLLEVDPAFAAQEAIAAGSGAEASFKGHGKVSTGLSTEEFVARLKIMRIHHETINDTYDQLQLTFGIKLLLDVVTNVFALLSVIAWFSMWSVNRELANAVTGAWNGLSAVIYTAALWLVCNRPLLLQNKHGKMVDEIEKVLYRRQMVKNMKPSREEISITFALRQRLKTKVLSFSAGGVLDIHGMAVSLVAGLAGFIAFIMERVEDFKAHMETNKTALADTANRTTLCTSHN